MPDEAREADPKEVAELRALLTRGGPAQLMWRGRIVLAFLDGATYGDLRDRFGGSPTSHSRWIRRFREHGLDGLRTRKRQPRKAPLRDSLLAWLPTVLGTSPQEHGFSSTRWTLESLQKLWERETSERISLESIRLALHQFASENQPADEPGSRHRPHGRSGRSWWRKAVNGREMSA
jgi:transposase